MRRYMQSGGNPAITIIGGLALAYVLAQCPKLMALSVLFGLVEPPKQGTMMRGGFFGINLASARDAATAITSKAQTKTIAVSKDTVINALNKLKDAFKADTNADQITNCVDKLVKKIQASDTTPENVSSEDIADSVGKAEDTTPAPQGETFDAMVTRVLRTKIDMLKAKYETAINDRIKSFKQKYKLGDDDEECMNVLKDAVLKDLINKKEELMKGIMDNKNVKTAIESAKRGGELLSAGADMLNGRLSSFSWRR